MPFPAPSPETGSPWAGEFRKWKERRPACGATGPRGRPWPHPAKPSPVDAARRSQSRTQDGVGPVADLTVSHGDPISRFFIGVQYSVERYSGLYPNPHFRHFDSPGAITAPHCRQVTDLALGPKMMMVLQTSQRAASADFELANTGMRILPSVLKKSVKADQPATKNPSIVYSSAALPRTIGVEQQGQINPRSDSAIGSSS